MRDLLLHEKYFVKTINCNVGLNKLISRNFCLKRKRRQIFEISTLCYRYLYCANVTVQMSWKWIQIFRWWNVRTKECTSSSSFYVRMFAYVCFWQNYSPYGCTTRTQNIGRRVSKQKCSYLTQLASQKKRYPFKYH